MKKDSIREIRLGLSGRTDLDDPVIRARIVTAWDSEPIFSPELMGHNERRLDEYSPAEITGEINTEVAFDLMIKRRKAVRFFGDIRGGAQPDLSYNFHPSISTKNIAKLFSWADTMAEAFQPEAGNLTIIPKLPDTESPEFLDYMKFLTGSIHMGGSYYQKGPLLGMHTWLGKHFIDLIGKDNLFAIPQAKVEDTSWGGVKIILGGFEKPWEIEFDILIDTWLTSMEYLWQFGVFCEQKVNPQFHENPQFTPILIKRGPRVTIPRMDGQLSKCWLSEHKTW